MGTICPIPSLQASMYNTSVMVGNFIIGIILSEVGVTLTVESCALNHY